MTILANIQDALLELGESTPSLVVGSNNTTGLQMLALMNRVADMLYTDHDWQFLAVEHRFQTVVKNYTGNTTNGSDTITGLSSVAGLTTDFMVTGTNIPQDTFLTSIGASSVTMNRPATGTGTGTSFTFGQAKYSMPSDFGRVINRTQWNKSNTWVVLGPKDAQEWQWIKSGYLATGPRQRFRIIGDKFVLWPMPAVAETIGFEYISSFWAKTSAGVAKGKFTLDDDTSFFPDRLLIMGTKLKFYEIKGLDTSILAADFERELSKYKAQQAGADILSLSPRFTGILLTEDNLKDSGYGV